jgi:hypothetical protein
MCDAEGHVFAAEGLFLAHDSRSTAESIMSQFNLSKRQKASMYARQSCLASEPEIQVMDCQRSPALASLM